MYSASQVTARPEAASLPKIYKYNHLIGDFKVLFLMDLIHLTILFFLIPLESTFDLPLCMKCAMQVNLPCIAAQMYLNKCWVTPHPDGHDGC